MRVLLLTTFAASKKEPLAAVMDRVRQAFLDAGLGEPVVRFNFGDASTAGFVSSVDRVLKRYPELERFVTSASPMPGIPGARRISNGPMSQASGETLAYTTLRAIAAGVPRSFPFHNVLIYLQSPEFGDMASTHMRSAEMLPGILLADSWWVTPTTIQRRRCVASLRWGAPTTFQAPSRIGSPRGVRASLTGPPLRSAAAAPPAPGAGVGRRST